MRPGRESILRRTTWQCAVPRGSAPYHVAVRRARCHEAAGTTSHENPLRASQHATDVSRRLNRTEEWAAVNVWQRRLLLHCTNLRVACRIQHNVTRNATCNVVGSRVAIVVHKTLCVVCCIRGDGALLRWSSLLANLQLLLEHPAELVADLLLRVLAHAPHHNDGLYGRGQGCARGRTRIMRMPWPQRKAIDAKRRLGCPSNGRATKKLRCPEEESASNSPGSHTPPSHTTELPVQAGPRVSHVCSLATRAARTCHVGPRLLKAARGSPGREAAWATKRNVPLNHFTKWPRAATW